MRWPSRHRAGLPALTPLAAALLSFALAGCGVKEERLATPLPATFKVLAANAKGLELAPLLLAAREGTAARAGISLAVASTSSQLQALTELAGGDGQAAVASQSQVLIARDRGLAVVGICSLDAADEDQPVLAVRVREAERDGETLRALLLAVGGAAKRVREDPALGLAALGLSPRRGEKQRLEAQLALAATPQPNEVYGFQDPASWSALAQSLYNRHQLLHDPTTLAPPYTNEYLPGQGL